MCLFSSFALVLLTQLGLGQIVAHCLVISSPRGHEFSIMSGASQLGYFIACMSRLIRQPNGRNISNWAVHMFGTYRSCWLVGDLGLGLQKVGAPLMLFQF